MNIVVTLRLHWSLKKNFRNKNKLSVVRSNAIIDEKREERIEKIESDRINENKKKLSIKSE